MSAETEQQRAARAYAAGRRQREDAQRVADNVRSGGANSAGAQTGGAR
ncbi:hypothetical protein [Streptomyces sp. CCM_MD2014]|nr:hypothetical protein [Streptomyces sp. CCM_MD2014]